MAIVLVLVSMPASVAWYGGDPAEDCPTVVTKDATNVTDSSMTLNGELKKMGDSQYVSVYFEWGTDTKFGNQTPIQGMSNPGIFSTQITGLTPETVYYFRAVAIGECKGYGQTKTATTLAGTGCIDPEVETNEATNVGIRTMQINGTLADMGNVPGGDVKVFFEWGLDTSYGNKTEQQIMTGTGPFSAVLEGLNADSEYHFRAVAIGCDDEQVNGENKSGTTYPEGACESPRIETNEATEIEITSARLNGTLLDMGSFEAGATVFFDWGLTDLYGNETELQILTETGTFSAVIDELEPDTVYHFRAVAIGCGGTGVFGMDMLFQTQSVECIPPDLETNRATRVLQNEATLNGRLLNMGTPPFDSVEVWFEWGTDTGYGNETSPQLMAEPDVFQAQLTGLNLETTYYFRAVATGCDDDNIYGDEMSFKTLAEGEPPEPCIPPVVKTGSATGITSNEATLNGFLELTGNSAYVRAHFQWGIDVGYGFETDTKILTQPGNFSVSLTGLQPDTEYHFIALAVGECGGEGEDVVFRTLPSGIGPGPGDMPPSVETGTPMDITTNSAILTGILKDLGWRADVNVSFEWDTNTEGTFANETDFRTMNGTGTFAILLEGLSEKTTYYFRAKAVGNGTDYGEMKEFTTLSPKPDVVTRTAKPDEITSDSALLEGTLESMGTAGLVDVYFEWGRTTDYGNETDPQSMDNIGAFQTKITGLDPDTEYHFRAKAVGDDIAFGNNMSFDTEGEGGGINPWVAIGPILALLLFAFLFYFFYLRRKRKEEEEAA